MERIPFYTILYIVLACMGLRYAKPTQKQVSKECKEPIGIQTGFLEDRDVKTSTSQKNFTIRDAWCSAQNNDKQFFAVDLGEDFMFSKVATQGKVDDKNRFVKSYELQFSSDNKEWKTYLSDGKKKTLDGNKDTFTVKYHKLSPDTVGRYVKLVPKSWNNGICSRMELYGCAVEDLKKPQAKDAIPAKEPEQTPVQDPKQAAAQGNQDEAPAQTPEQNASKAQEQASIVKEVVPEAPNTKEVPKRDSEANWNFVAAAANSEPADAGVADNADLLELSRQLGTPAQR